MKCRPLPALNKPWAITGLAIATGFCVFVLQACAAKSVETIPALQIEGVAIENQTQMWVSAAKLLVPVTGRFVSCGNIAPGSLCSTTFPEAAYKGDAIEISWSQAGQIHSTGQFSMDIPEDIDRNRFAKVLVVIAGPGSAGAVIVQPEED